MKSASTFGSNVTNLPERWQRVARAARVQSQWKKIELIRVAKEYINSVYLFED